MDNETVFKLYPKQMRFIRSRRKHTAYGGARAGGKSFVLRLDACRLCQKYPGIRVLIVRRTLEDVRKNHIIPLEKILRGIARYNQTKRCFLFPNGSVIEFQYYDCEADVDHFQGIEWDVIFIDEATQFPEEWIKNITTCCRGGPPGYPKQIFYTCNPGGPGHGYIKRLFVDRKYEANEKPEDYEFIQAFVTDNRYIMETQPEYLDFLRNLSPKLRAAWLYGDWNIFEGQFFDEFRVEPDIKAALAAGVNATAEELKEQHRWTHVIEPFPRIRRNWPIYRSFDWGSYKPFSMGYYTMDENDVMYRICEYYGARYEAGKVLPDTGLKWPFEKVCAEIQQYEREHPYLAGREITGVADPAIWKADGGVSFAEVASHYGIFFTPGDHNRIPGWNQCRYRLMFDEAGYSHFYVFETCKEFIRTIPLLQHDAHKVEDIDSDGEDHIADEWRYFCMSRPMDAEILKEVYWPKFGSDPLGQFKRA